MKITFRGVYTLSEFFQALYQERHKLEDLGITHVRGAALYYQPVDEYGDPVSPRHPNGQPIQGWNSKGPYRSAAQEYDI